MKKCFDAGTIQAFLDGELANDLEESVARHVAECEACAALLSEAEEETAFAFAALESEFNSELVPTNRLWTKINDSIERENGKSIWKTAIANFKSLFANPSIAALAGLLVVAALFLAARNSGEDKNYAAARENQPKQEIVLPKNSGESSVSIGDLKPTRTTKAALKITPSVKEKNNYRVVKTNFVKEENARQTRKDAAKSVAPKSAAPEFVSGEETYVKTIAALEKTVNSRKDEALKPSARFSFEKDLAVADDAIARMKSEVKQNPKNDAAKQILRASYQNKVDLLNSVADKTELMASLK